MFKYLRYSNIKIAIDLNPFAWGFKCNRQSDPPFHIIYFRFLFLSITFVIDNGAEYVLMGLNSDMFTINKDDEMVDELETDHR